MKSGRFFLLLLIVFCSVKCTTGADGQRQSRPLFTLRSPDVTGVHFSNQLYETTDLNIITYEYMYNGAGVAVGDINGDGLPDIYFSGNMVPGKLYLNKGDFVFEDITDEAGIRTSGQWGTGVSMVDINNDGLLDLYLCFSGPYEAAKRKNKLYINNGNLTFTEQAGFYGLDDDAHTTHAAFLDYDRDGDLDVYLLNNTTDNLGPNIIRPKRVNGEMANTDRLYRNDRGKFTNVSAAAGILHEGYGLGVAVGDINRDDWPDIYVSNDYLSNDLLYINNRDGTFTEQAGASFKHTSYSSMGCDMADYNNDGQPDIVALDMLPPDNTRRKLMVGSYNYNRYRSEMLNGYFPQYIRNTLQLNRGIAPDGSLVFSEIGLLAGIQSTDWSWSPLLQDLDNDGLKDLVITNGYPRDITNMDFASYKAGKMMKGGYNDRVLKELIREVNQIKGAYLPNYVFKNQGDLTFSDRSADWGFTQPSFSYGAAVADLDNDGDLDYITNNSYDTVFIYENHAQQHFDHHFLRLTLKGNAENQGAIGAKVRLFAGAVTQYYEHYPFRGYQSSIEPVVHFGLGGKNLIDSVIVQWPDNNLQTIRNPAPDQVLAVRYKPGDSEKAIDGDLPKTISGNSQKTTLGDSQKIIPDDSQKTNSGDSQKTIPGQAHNRVFLEKNVVSFTHQEAHHSDFLEMPLLPHKHSQEGPGISAGDVNGDSLDDFFIGGASGQPGQLFIQMPDGSFEAGNIPAMNPVQENTGCLFFDADMDGDLDLYVAAGGSEFPAASENYQDRIYRNDGNGNFVYDPTALPEINASTSCVIAADFDKDGDNDLFVGGRVVPGRYPEAPRSFLLENQAGRFVDVTASKAPGLNRYGMITDAKWVDIDGDGWMDLMLCGEWLPVSLFKNEGGNLANQTTQAGLSQTFGWWNSLEAADLDRDGDPDLIAGNLGLNTHYKTSPQQPLSLYTGDYDDNGKPDPIIVHYLQDKQVPVHFRDDLLSWIFPLRKKFPDYESYASANWQDFFPDRQTDPVPIDLFVTSWIENLGSGRFRVHPLPTAAQTAPVYGLLAGDFNCDQHPDLLLTGNSSAANPFDGQYDAFNGLLLLGNGQGNFKPQSFRQSGFFVPGEGRALVRIMGADGKPLVLAAQSNGPLKCFQY